MARPRSIKEEFRYCMTNSRISKIDVIIQLINLALFDSFIQSLAAILHRSVLESLSTISTSRRRISVHRMKDTKDEALQPRLPVWVYLGLLWRILSGHRGRHLMKFELDNSIFYQDVFLD